MGPEEEDVGVAFIGHIGCACESEPEGPPCVTEQQHRAPAKPGGQAGARMGLRLQRQMWLSKARGLWASLG